MKTIATLYPSKQNRSTPKISMIIAGLLMPLFLSAQNLTTNSSFNSGTTGWTNTCTVEIYPETTYGGTNASNNVTEIDKETCIDQDVCIMPGVTYVLSFKGTRRTAGGAPSSVGINVKIKGVNTGTTYINQDRNYNNTTFNYTTQTYAFTVAANSNDRKINIHIKDNNNHTTLGAILDDIELRPQTELAISGSTSALVGATYNYAVSNSPAAGITYNWSMGANATNASSTSATPSTGWTTAGNKTMSVSISNSSCVVTSLSAAVVVSGVLPVTFTNFTGIIKDNKAALTWSTGREENNSHFIIERSANGRTYDSVGRVQAGSNISNTYTFTENNTNAISYYRLKQVDISGTYMYSSVVTLKNTGSSREMTVYPAQATSTVQYVISNNAQATATLQVFNLAGQSVMSQKEVLQQGVNIRSLNVSQLATGTYILKLQVPATGVTAIKQFQKL
ncbi:T9SS type A sorting domain-containing protein [Niastella caeni]|nr:T9SS type A sorting domain-containing protein [Niastella caeni]